MLRELRVENYAVIDNVVVQFRPGLNLLTGETGAGKSILIDALGLLFGEKASSEVVRHGTARAVVMAVFDLGTSSADSVLEANGLDGEGSELILRREIAATGKSRVFINNQPATVSALKQLAPFLGTIHAQNESFRAFEPPSRLALLDASAGIDTAPVEQAYSAWREVGEKIAELERGEQDKLRLVDLWSFQLKEIETAKPEPDEDQKLEAEKRVLANAERLYAAAQGAYDALYESAGSTLATIRAAAKQLDELARFDESFRETVQQLASARITIEDVSQTVRDYADGIDASPERLAEIEDRLAVLDRLRRKYGQTVVEVLSYADDLRRKLNEIENKDEVLRELRAQQTKAAQRYLELARALSRRRYETARKLEKTVEAEINDLSMKARFSIEVSGSDEEGNWSPSGFDRVAYLISTNTGDPMGPIEHIASGGELSRVMLALKASVEAGRGNKTADSQRTLIFDEIDTGIGGRAADAVGKKLKSLSRNKQVICITHLPQIASFADQHFLIEKDEQGSQSRTAVRPLGPEDRKRELARMLSGAKVTEASLKNAEQMLKVNA